MTFARQYLQQVLHITACHPVIRFIEAVKKMSGTIDLYYQHIGPPSQCVMMVAKAVGVTLNLKSISVLGGEHMTPEYLKINPQHTIPVLDDNGFILVESRAIMQYLVDKYAIDDTLNPKEPEKAAVVNHRLYFDACTLYPRLYDYFLPVLLTNGKPDPDRATKFVEALEWLDGFLENSVWVAGETMTVADFAIVVTIATAEAMLFDIDKHSNVSSWYEKAKNAMAEYGYEEITQVGAAMLGGFYKCKLK